MHEIRIKRNFKTTFFFFLVNFFILFLKRGSGVTERLYLGRGERKITIFFVGHQKHVVFMFRRQRQRICALSRVFSFEFLINCARPIN